MSTNQKCFVCKNKIQPLNNLTNNIKQRQECKRFHSLVCRYLNIVDDNGIDKSSHTSSRNPKKTLSPSESMLQGDEPISCCDVCIPLIKSFCETYNNWKILQLVLNWKLETITKLMLMKSELNQSDGVGHDEPGFEKFRKRFLTIATDKSRDFPRLNIPKAKVRFRKDRVATEEIMDKSGVESPEISDFENDDIEDLHVPKLQDKLQQESGLEMNSVTAAERKAKRKTTLKSHHEDTAKKSAICRICRKEFISIEDCRRHEKIHSGVKPYKCRYNCGKRYSRDSNRKYHEISIHKRNLAKHQCKFCAKKYVEKSALIGHERTHTGEQPYSCCVCNKNFSLKCNWQKHERKHKKGPMWFEARKRDQSNWKYKCRYCSKRFEKQSVQIMHERVHTGIKPYSCRFCDKTFCRRFTQKRHELEVHEQKETSVNGNNKILKKVKQEFQVEQQNNATADFQDDVGNGNSDGFHNNSEAILVCIVKTENENLESV